MPWAILIIAGICEVVWAVAMKESDGFSRLVPTAIMIVGMIASVVLLSLAMKTLPLGTAYAVWTGIGALGAFLVGIVALGEPTNALRLGSAALILIGLVGLKLA